MPLIKLAISTLPDSIHEMNEHLLSEWMEASDELRAWQKDGEERATKNASFHAELADIQFMAASISKQQCVEVGKIPLRAYIPSPAARERYALDIYRAWTRMCDKLIKVWNYINGVKRLTRSQERNIKTFCQEVIVAVEYVLAAIGLSSSERDLVRDGVYYKNRMRGYYDE